jgi:hypothetical protein
MRTLLTTAPSVPKTVRTIVKKTNYFTNLTATLFPTFCLLFEIFFTSTPTASPKESKPTEKGPKRLLGIGDNLFVFLLF